MSAAPGPAADFSFAILRAFVGLGVTDAVLTPGSRSQALALTLAEFDRAGVLDLRVRLDERVAGFTALGIAAETGIPAIVVTTSGTAVANLLPAVLEAYHSRVPMLIVTADRPAAMRGTAGNQTTHQPGIFGRFTRRAIDVPAPAGLPGEAGLAVQVARDAYAAALGEHLGTPGPVHVNLQFREPLSGAVPDVAALLASGEWMPGVSAVRDTPPAQPAFLLDRGPRTVVIAGNHAGPAAEELAHRGGWPLIAEPSSGARFGRNLVVAYRELLADADLGGRVERAVVFGHPTLSREVTALALRDDVEVVVVSPSAASVPPGVEVPDVFNPGHRVQTFVTAAEVVPPPAAGSVDGGASERGWLRDWALASRAVTDAQAGDDPVAAPDIELANSPEIAERRAYRLAETAALKAPITRRTLSLAVWQATWPHDRLILGASRLIRDLDRAVPGKKIRVHANRGLAGIDGTIATATGIALASQSGRPSASDGSRPTRPTSSLADARPRSSESPTPAAQHGVTRVLLGDLTLLHDAGALLFGTGEVRPRIQLIVANDGGGTIFDTLEVAATADRAAFDRVMLTPQTVDLEALAKAYGWSYSRVSTRVELDRALTAPLTGPALLEVPLPR
ncbi:2-succinyl-5-enolpyruvyl-6-hydroxy-3-cyclohexene-1-carboxylic-acid synthase [Subtercola boreus]|uniref:2-succinyl-5-enolpyruvyl-6-hydroxy-3-cyclohexene-1-carboxylate synthase n=1 Tax=Subtercola boreus TaxID=120213 RepID=A0A3E0WEH9_9MICO|nr:2-succinyl-5-enolpyruvyl-6-hydroxy-3-cyclohexene-1-carboxylic-acid synthase [Subtercola boreus]RFA23648.1 2-succinyl-5-enolpyruvyl-6-hydroxy-3-cyclohexene-1-carboxylic-acid synthase [Subtercola boreus]RFA24042.1 2-succinyl-5-enolpyruvyl-6-hydroxy-3-cyclohexene-1-carboxylic-acid synthase [Subtercola boreus]RFA29740.1 2-succinyl-5-enolpyruvyl-6-hydroxy-3-cyclohexene-1-carboxylic-acid synthase [Subtercola boreus]